MNVTHWDRLPSGDIDAFDPSVEPPPAHTNSPLLVRDEALGWWLGFYLPDDDEYAYTLRAWHLVGLDGYEAKVTHWLQLTYVP